MFPKSITIATLCLSLAAPVAGFSPTTTASVRGKGISSKTSSSPSAIRTLRTNSNSILRLEEKDKKSNLSLFAQSSSNDDKDSDKNIQQQERRKFLQQTLLLVPILSSCAASAANAFGEDIADENEADTKNYRLPIPRYVHPKTIRSHHMKKSEQLL